MNPANYTLFLYPIIGIAAIGVARALWGIVADVYNLTCVKRYISRFDEYTSYDCSSEREKYLGDWLEENSAVLQKDMGSLGLGAMRWPGVGPVSNIPILINILNLVRSGIADNSEISGCRSCLLRHVGVIKYGLKQHLKDLINPLAWIREGVKSLLSIPFVLWAASGQHVNKNAEQLALNRVAPILSLVSSIAAFIFAVAGFVSDYDNFTKWLKYWLPFW